MKEAVVQEGSVPQELPLIFEELIDCLKDCRLIIACLLS